MGLLACQPSAALWLAVLAVAAVSAWFDLRTGCIPNWVTLGALVLALAGQAALGAVAGGWVGLAQGLLRSAVGSALAGSVPLWLFQRGAMGGGDVKLLLGVGALGGACGGVTVELYAFVLAAAFVAVRLGRRGELARAGWRTLRLLSARRVRSASRPVEEPAPDSEVRFAPFVLVGACLFALSGAPWA